MAHGHTTAATRADLVRRDADSGPGHLHVADRLGPAFKHLTSMRGISRGLRQACGKPVAAINGMRQNRAFRRPSRGGAVAAEPAVATQKRKIFHRKNAAWQGSQRSGDGNSNAASTGPEQRDEFRGSAAPRHRRSRGALATMQSSVAKPQARFDCSAKPVIGAFTRLTALPRTP